MNGLINNSKSLSTGKAYANLGEIYNDAIKFIPENAKLLNFVDDDDEDSAEALKKNLPLVYARKELLKKEQCTLV